MANPQCMYPECEQAALFTGTFFQNGTSVTVCSDHFVDFAAGTLEAMTGAPVIDFLAGGPGAVLETVVAPEASPSDNGHVEITNADIDVVHADAEPDVVDGADSTLHLAE